MASKGIFYDDGEIASLGDHVEVGGISLLYEPEMATVKVVGAKKLLVEFDNEYIKPRREWVRPDECIMISREAGP